MFPICHAHMLALLCYYFNSVTCVYSVISSLQRWCTRCRVPFSDAGCCLPVTVYHSHAHLVHMCWQLLWGLHQMGRRCATFGTYALVGSLKWIMRVLNSQSSRLRRLHHPSLQSTRTLPPEGGRFIIFGHFWPFLEGSRCIFFSSMSAPFEGQ